MSEEEKTPNFEENVREVVPESPAYEIIRPIEGDKRKRSTKEKEIAKNKALMEKNRKNKKRNRAKMAKMSRKRNRGK